jgi:hypothetical protein
VDCLRSTVTRRLSLRRRRQRSAPLSGSPREHLRRDPQAAGLHGPHTRILAVLPLAYVARRTRDVRVGIVAHVLLNATDLIVLLGYLTKPN